MKNWKILLLAAAAAFTLNGCTTFMPPAETKTTAVPNGKAAIVIYRDSYMAASAYTVPVAEVNENAADIAEGLRLVGIMKNRDKIVDVVDPGLHTYVFTRGFAKTIGKVQAAAGKVYYIDYNDSGWTEATLIRIWNAQEAAANKDDIAGCDEVVLGENAVKWFAGHKKSLAEDFISCQTKFKQTNRNFATEDYGIDTIY